MPRRPSSATWARILVVFSVCVPLVAFAAAQEPEYDVDIVASTNLSVSKEHTAAYLSGLASEGEAAFSSLRVRMYEPEEKPKDGAAHYRFSVEHKGTVTVGSTMTSRGGFPKSDIKTFANGKRLDIVVGTDFKYHQTMWYLPVSHKGTLAFKFQKWDGSAYKVLESWSITAPDADEVAEAKGMLQVADLVQDGNKVKIDLKPKCPKTLAQAKNDALMKLMAGEFSRSIHSKFAKGTVAKTKADGSGMAEVEVLVENKSPWPLKQAKADAFVQGAVIAGELEFNPAIAPGKSAKAKFTATPDAPETKRIPGVRLSELRYEPAKK